MKYVDPRDVGEFYEFKESTVTVLVVSTPIVREDATRISLRFQPVLVPTLGLATLDLNNIRVSTSPSVGLGTGFPANQNFPFQLDFATAGKAVWAAWYGVAVASVGLQVLEVFYRPKRI